MQNIKPIAIYLPQYHTIPENDKAWGAGFTEWTNVRKAQPVFDGHYQPHIPHEDVGYYDLRNPEVMVRQATMAKKFGIYGFAFYHYWFNGKRLLETPLDNMLKTGSPDFPFLYIWANENWTKRWDGQDNEIIIDQKYTHEDDLNHIRFLCENVFSDKRYINIDNKPVFVVYRTELLPNINETVRIWREEVKKYGFNDLYLIRVENFKTDINPSDIGFDASMEFAPESRAVESKTIGDNNTLNYVIDNEDVVVNMALSPEKSYPWFRCVSPGWDNSARRSANAYIYVNNTALQFKMLFFRACRYTERFFNKDSQLLFVNAWNEWGEGCHLEPDKKNGYIYLEQIDEVLNKNTPKNMDEYIDFIDGLLKSQINERKEYLNLKADYRRIMQSHGHKYMEKALVIYRGFKRKLK